MKEVSEPAQEIFTKLLAWEMSEGREDLDPKILLRQVPLADLSVIARNLQEAGGFVLSSAVARLVLIEMHYRTGHVNDWDLKKDGNELILTLRPREPIKFVNINVELEKKC